MATNASQKDETLHEYGQGVAELSVVTVEAQAYAESREYDCCQIIEGAYTVGDAVCEAYCAGREAPPTDTEIMAAAKCLKANPGLFGPSTCFIDPNRFEEIARSLLQAARTVVQAKGNTIK